MWAARLYFAVGFPVGVTMAVLTTVIWVGMLIVSALIERRALKNAPAAVEE